MNVGSNTAINVSSNNIRNNNNITPKQRLESTSSNKSNDEIVMSYQNMIVANESLELRVVTDK